MNRFSPNLVCALILWRSGLGLLMGKFCQVLTELSAQMAEYYSLTFLFLDNLYIFVWLQHGCSRNTVFVSVSSNSFIKR